MGITGLLPFLEKASSGCHLRELRGKCVAIDSYCWLHRGAFGCAERLARGESTDAHIQYCLKYVQLLLSYNIKPILVFDGQHLPAKAATEAKRRENRENARKRGAELLRLGRIDEARSFLRRCVDITHEMALQLIQECRKRGVDCVVAPYEADAQLAYLNRADIAQYVITEDSDLVLFGCSRVLFKLDLTGNGRLVEASKLHIAMGCREDRYKFEKFRYMCILSGCDYLDSLPGIGLGKACRFIMKTEDPDIRRALAKIPSYLNMRQLTVTEEYKDDFLKANATFKHMVVYDPVHRCQTRLEDPADEGTEEQYCCNAGKLLDEKTAFQLAIGNLDPFSLRKMDNWHPDRVDDETDSACTAKRRHPSIWNTDYSALKDEILSQKAHTQRSSSQKASSLASFVKRPPPNVDFVEQGTKETIGDVLHAYGIQNDEPPLKRLCPTQKPAAPGLSSCAIEYADLEALDTMAQLEQPTTPKRNRNPFVVGSRVSPETLLSPTKITPENRSLLHNISPVKRIDYRAVSTTTSAISRRVDRVESSTTRGSIHGSGEQKVISRFFCTQSTRSQVTRTNSLKAEPCRSDVPQSGTAGAAIPESPTAIVKEIRSHRSSNVLRATALYLTSPEAMRQNRGERTPEKRSLKDPRDLETGKSVAPDRLDSGIVVSEDELKEDQSSQGGGSSSSQKENDDVVEIVADKDDSTVKSRTVRLALFERKPEKRIVSPSEPLDAAELLATVIIDEGTDPGTGNPTVNLCDGAELKTDTRTGASQPKAEGSNVSNRPGLSKAKPSCRRPGLSGKRKPPPAKADDTKGMTQSRLSMFGFQKKPSMQL